MRHYFSALLLILLWSSTVMADENNTGRLSGAWIPRKYGPISGGLIYAFDTNAGPPPLRDRARRVPDAVVMTNEKGKFTLQLPEGTYYLSTLKKFGSAAPGPPQDGDLHALSRDEKGKPVIYKVKRGKTNNIGILRQATVFKSPVQIISADTTAITGTLTASDGSPLADAVVQVYTDKEVKGKPAYVSQKTGKDGKYIVQVDKEGTYYLAIRAKYGGGRPQEGDTLGVYGGESAQPVTVKIHSVTAGIDIRAGQFADKRPK